MSNSIGKNVIFYDGYCGFCDSWVKSIFERDRRGVFWFAALQGKLALEVLDEEIIRNLNQIAYRQEDGRILLGAEAVVAIARQTTGWLRILGMMAGVLPHRLLDKMYRTVASHRAKLKVTCPIATQEQRQRSLA